MRLICPNCAAQYDVPEDVIPDDGRDVQCSNCGNTWFQPGAGTAALHEDMASEPDPTPEPPQETSSEEIAPQTVQDSAADAGPSPETSPAVSPAREEPWAEPEEPDLAAPDAEDDDPPLASAPKAAENRHQRGLDPELADILREEAERETRMRVEETAPLESQPNLGLDDLPESEESRRTRQSRDRMARMQGEDPRLQEAKETGQRRGLFPDIEEINSTLRAEDAAVAEQQNAPEPSPKRSGFRSGFVLTLLLMAALILIYSNAPKIAQAVPTADPYLSGLVTMVDQARLWLDAQVQALQPPPQG